MKSYLIIVFVVLVALVATLVVVSMNSKSGEKDDPPGVDPIPDPATEIWNWGERNIHGYETYPSMPEVTGSDPLVPGDEINFLGNDLLQLDASAVYLESANDKWTDSDPSQATYTPVIKKCRGPYSLGTQGFSLAVTDEDKVPGATVRSFADAKKQCEDAGETCQGLGFQAMQYDGTRQFYPKPFTDKDIKDYKASTDKNWVALKKLNLKNCFSCDKGFYFDPRNMEKGQPSCCTAKTSGGECDTNQSVTKATNMAKECLNGEILRNAVSEMYTVFPKKPPTTNDNDQCSALDPKDYSGSTIYKNQSLVDVQEQCTSNKDCKAVVCKLVEKDCYQIKSNDKNYLQKMIGSFYVKTDSKQPEHSILIRDWMNLSFSDKNLNIFKTFTKQKLKSKTLCDDDHPYPHVNSLSGVCNLQDRKYWAQLEGFDDFDFFYNYNPGDLNPQPLIYKFLHGFLFKDQKSLYPVGSYSTMDEGWRAICNNYRNKTTNKLDSAVLGIQIEKKNETLEFKVLKLGNQSIKEFYSSNSLLGGNLDQIDKGNQNYRVYLLAPINCGYVNTDKINITAADLPKSKSTCCAHAMSDDDIKTIGDYKNVEETCEANSKGDLKNNANYFSEIVDEFFEDNVFATCQAPDNYDGNCDNLGQMRVTSKNSVRQQKFKDFVSSACNVKFDQNGICPDGWTFKQQSALFPSPTPAKNDESSVFKGVTTKSDNLKRYVQGIQEIHQGNLKRLNTSIFAQLVPVKSAAPGGKDYQKFLESRELVTIYVKGKEDASATRVLGSTRSGYLEFAADTYAKSEDLIEDLQLSYYDKFKYISESVNPFGGSRPFLFSPDFFKNYKQFRFSLDPNGLFILMEGTVKDINKFLASGCIRFRATKYNPNDETLNEDSGYVISTRPSNLVTGYDVGSKKRTASNKSFIDAAYWGSSYSAWFDSNNSLNFALGKLAGAFKSFVTKTARAEEKQL